MVTRWVLEDYWRSQSQSVTFYAVGAPQQFVVPDGVDEVFLTLRGGNGGGHKGDGYIATGGLVSGWLPVQSGDILSVYVGGNGGAPRGVHGAAGGWNGGGAGGDSNPSRPDTTDGGYGGGGATDVRLNGAALADRVAVAAGGGGTSGHQHSAGPGGADVGGRGFTHRGGTYRFRGVTQTYNGFPNVAGFGGTQNAGGAGGDGHVDGRPGALGQGGDGADNLETHYHSGAGGGGGGYFGGGGGATQVQPGPPLTQITEVEQSNFLAYGGGGGSNYVDDLADTDTGTGDHPYKVRNERGDQLKNVTTAPVPHASIHYRQTPVELTLPINPNAGGSPQVSKNLAISQNVGPGRVNIVQEGQAVAPTMPFSGFILTQEHYESLEYWFSKRIVIRITDDLGRRFVGIFSAYSPQRVRKPYNPWYHTFDATFTLSAYTNASGIDVYGGMD